MERELNEILKLLDNYNRVARLYPAILVLLPAAITSGLIVGEDIGTKVLTCLVVAVALGTLLVNIARSQGKAIERELLKAWGVWPTTRFLRHRDDAIERPTKARYHVELKRLCTGVKMPHAAAEAQSPSDADATYRSATRKLIELRRDEKYKLVHKELAHYGFRRNLLGLKSPALWVIGISTAWVGAAILIGLPNIRVAYDVAVDAQARAPLYAAISANIVAAIIWLTSVHRDFVHQSATEYAFALLRSLDA
jgi:hypothetical protein